jgi:hypothetical protein
MKYYYTREESVNGEWNVNYPSRINQYNKMISLAEEIENAFPNKSFLFFAGYDDNENEIMIDFKDYTLTEEEKELLDIVVSDHKNNVPDKYGVWYQDAFIPDPSNPESAYLFDTEEQAQQFIIHDNLEGADVKGVVVL